MPRLLKRDVSCYEVPSQQQEGDESERRASKRQRGNDSRNAPPATSVLSSLLGWSKSAEGASTWAFEFSDCKEPATRLQSSRDAAVVCLHRLSEGRVHTVTKMRRQLCKSDVDTSTLASIAGASVLAALAYAVPHTAVRSALAFGAAANAVTGVVRQQVGWHHLVMLEGPRVSMTLELLDTGLRVKVIEADEDRSQSTQLLHRRDLEQHRFDERCVTLAEVVQRIPVLDITLAPAAKMASYYNAHDYDLLTWNCQHFADELCAAYTAYREGNVISLV